MTAKVVASYPAIPAFFRLQEDCKRKKLGRLGSRLLKLHVQGYALVRLHANSLLAASICGAPTCH